MEVLDLIYHQFFFTTKRLGRQPLTSQYFQPLVPQTLALAATAIHCALSEYASGRMATVEFAQDEYRGRFGSFLMINFTPEATIQSITHRRPLHTLHPLRGHSTAIEAPQSSSELLCRDSTSSISFCSQFLLSQRSCISFRTLYPSPVPRPSAQDGSSSFPTGAPIMHYTLLTHPCSALLLWNNNSSIPSVLLCLNWLSWISFWTA